MLSAFLKLLSALGCLCLFHSCVSVNQYHKSLKVSGQEFTSLPADIIVELLVGTLLTLLGAVYLSGNLKHIRTAVHMAKLPFDQLNSRPDFVTFNHRGQTLNKNARTHN